MAAPRPAATTSSSSAAGAPAPPRPGCSRRRDTTSCVVERSDLAGDPLSTHGLARGGVVQLARWGLLDEVLASGAPPSREVTFGVEGARHPAGEGPVRGGPAGRPASYSPGPDPGAAPRSMPGRRSAPATTVREVLRDARRPGRPASSARTAAGDDITLLGRWVVGADGLRSTMAGHLGARCSSPSAPT